MSEEVLDHILRLFETMRLARLRYRNLHDKHPDRDVLLTAMLRAERDFKEACELNIIRMVRHYREVRAKLHGYEQSDCHRLESWHAVLPDLRGR